MNANGGPPAESVGFSGVTKRLGLGLRVTATVRESGPALTTIVAAACASRSAGGTYCTRLPVVALRLPWPASDQVRLEPEFLRVALRVVGASPALRVRVEGVTVSSAGGMVDGQAVRRERSAISAVDRFRVKAMASPC